MCLAQGHNTVMPVRLKPPALLSRDKHNTTEPLHSNLQEWSDPGLLPYFVYAERKGSDETVRMPRLNWALAACQYDLYKKNLTCWSIFLFDVCKAHTTASLPDNLLSTIKLNPLYTVVTPKCILLANSEDPDEMLNYVAFHQGLHYLPRQKWSSAKE